MNPSSQPDPRYSETPASNVSSPDPRYGYLEEGAESAMTAGHASDEELVARLSTSEDGEYPEVDDGTENEAPAEEPVERAEVTYDDRPPVMILHLRYPFKTDDGEAVDSVSIYPPDYHDCQAAIDGRMDRLDLIANMCGFSSPGVFAWLRLPDADRVFAACESLVPEGALS